MEKKCCKCHKSVQLYEIWYGLHKECFSRWFRLNKVEEFSDIAAKFQSQPDFNQRINSSFFHGKFRKYSSRLGGISYILKVEQNEYPELPISEYLSNQIFECLKVKVPEYFLVRFPEHQFCFVTKNFMTDNSSTLNHIYHFIEPGMEYNCENIIDIIGQKTGRRIEQEKFAYLTLADSLIGNNDRHGRNLGFIKSTKGTVLAPFYDNPSAIGVEESSFLGTDLQPRGYIFTKESNEPTMKDYVREWERLGYQKIIERFKKNISLKKIGSLVNKSHLSDKRKQALLRLMNKRCNEL